MERKMFTFALLCLLFFIVGICESQTKEPDRNSEGKTELQDQIESLIKQLGDANTRTKASHILAEIGEPAVPALINVLRNEKDMRTRMYVLFALGHIGEPAVPALMKGLEYMDSLEVGDVFRKIGEPAVPALIIALKTDRDINARRKVISALGQIGEHAKGAVPALIHVLKDEDLQVRRGGAFALGQIGEPAVPALIEALKDDNREVRGIAISILGQIGQPAHMLV